MSNQVIYLITTWAIPAIIAITFHEAAHGFAAHQLGDDTAWRLGRVTLNPVRHIDLYGTILLPGVLLLLGSPVLFGYAKPVPVNFAWSHRHAPASESALSSSAQRGVSAPACFEAAVSVRRLLWSAFPLLCPWAQGAAS